MGVIDPDVFVDPLVVEDKGLFKSGVTQMQFDLFPQWGESRRGDWVVTGRIETGHQIDVVFAGRRVAAARRLKGELVREWRKAVQAAPKGQRPGVHEVKLSVRIEGSWRAVFKRDMSGRETRRHQFIAARWTYFASDDTIEVAGEPVAQAFEKPATEASVPEDIRAALRG